MAMTFFYEVCSKNDHTGTVKLRYNPLAYYIIPRLTLFFAGPLGCSSFHKHFYSLITLVISGYNVHSEDNKIHENNDILSSILVIGKTPT